MAATNAQRHAYEYEFDVDAQNAAAHVVRLVGHGKQVLEIGCGSGSITRVLAQRNGCVMTGIELDPAAIAKATPYCAQVIRADLNSSRWPDLLDAGRRFDVVLAADVLEHLYDPWAALRQMTQLVAPDGCVVVSLPHVGHAAVMACLVNGDFEYRDWGLLDRTHIRFFGLKNIEDLFAQAELKIIEAKYVVAAPEATEFAPGWARLAGSVKRALMRSEHAQVYQVVVKAVALARAGAAVPLAPSRHERRVWTLEALKARIAARLSPQTKARIRTLLRRLGIGR